MKTKALVAAILLVVAAHADAAPITYDFTATYWTDVEGPVAGPTFLGAPALFVAPSISGSFTYDSEATLISGPDPAIYRAAITNFSASVGGYTVSDPTGYAAVYNNANDYVLSIDPDVASVVPPEFRNIESFAIGDWSLENIRLFWAYAPTDPRDLVPDGSLPPTLPPPLFSPSESRVALDFINTTTNQRHITFFQNFTLTPTSVPVPGVLALFSFGLIGAAFARRRVRGN